MSKAPLRFEVNERVTHDIYGPGTILEIGGDRTVIDFDLNGRRKFVTSMVRLERTTIMAPARPARKSRAKAPKAEK